MTVTERGRRSVTITESDNVTTILDDQSELGSLDNGMAIAKGIAFGHKVALRDIAPGDPVIKYGVTIGHAEAAIPAGEHVHVHNCK